MNRTKHKLLSGIIAAALLLQTAMSATVFAAEPAAKTIVGFSALEQSDYTLPLGADETATKKLVATFPEIITADVEYIVTEEVADSKLSDTSPVEKVVSEEVELAVTWESGKPLTTEKAGTFTYTAVLSDTDKGRYDFASDVSLPQLTVAVAETMKRTLLGGAAIVARTTTLDLTGTVSYQKADNSTVAVDASANSITDTAEGWSWDKANNTLTLNGVNIKGEDSSSCTYGIVLPADSTIVLNGSNKVQAGDSAIISTDDNYWRVNSGVYGEGAITIEGDGTLEATGGKATGEYAQSNGICAESNVIIKGGTVTAIGGEAAGSVGIYTNSGAVEISGGTVTATGVNAPNASMGILLHDGALTISGASTVTATAGEANGISSGISTTGGLIISGASTVTATAGESNRNSTGMRVLGDATISGASTITATGKAGTSSYGIDVSGELTISGGTVTATAGKAGGDSGGINVNGALTISGGTVTATAGEEGASNTGIYVGDDATISGGTVTATAEDADNESIGIRAEGDVTISGGTVTATAGESGVDVSAGIAVNKAVKISGGKITAKSNTFAVVAAEGIILGAGAIKMGIVTPVGGKIVAYELINGQVIVTASGDPAKEVVIEQFFSLALSEAGTNASGAGMYTAGQTVDIKAGTKDGYTFKNWTSSNGITFADANSASTSFIMPASAVTVTANWTKNVAPPPDGGNNGGSSGGNNGVTTPPATTPPATTEKPNLPTQGSITVAPTISGNTAAVTVSEASIRDAITKAQAEAKQNGKSDNGISVKIKADTKNATSLKANLPKSAVDALVSAGVKEVRIISGVATFSLNLSTLQAIQKQAGGDATVTATKVANSTLSTEARALVGNRPIYDLSITGKNGVKVTSFGNGTISVAIPYTIGAKEKAGNVVAYYIDSAGKAKELPNSVYDAETKTLSFITNHFSIYAVGYKAKAATFTDIADHWTKDSIEFVAARGLLASTGEGKFSPNSAITYAELSAALSKLSGMDLGSIIKSSKDKVTREQIAVIMELYASIVGYQLPKVNADSKFVDSEKISSKAKDAVKSMQMAGVVVGKSGNKFDPQGTATRAEVSAVLKRFVELAVSTDSAQGWVRNDSGKWMFYENGKPVIGTKSIGGVSYKFDNSGETADLPKNSYYGSYTVKAGDSWWKIANAHKCSVSELARINGKTTSSMIHSGDVLKIPQKL